MDFEYTAQQEAFRAEVRDWLRNNLPPELVANSGRYRQLYELDVEQPAADLR